MRDILKLDNGRVFEPELVDVMGQAYTAAWERLRDRPRGAIELSDLRAELAKRVIDLAAKGERDPGRLASFAVAMMRM